MHLRVRVRVLFLLRVRVLVTVSFQASTAPSLHTLGGWYHLLVFVCFRHGVLSHTEYKSFSPTFLPSPPKLLLFFALARSDAAPRLPATCQLHQWTYELHP